MKEEPELNDCSGCGSSFVLIEMNHKVPFYRIRCGECQNQTRGFKTKQEAVEEWNNKQHNK